MIAMVNVQTTVEADALTSVEDVAANVARHVQETVAVHVLPVVRTGVHSRALVSAQKHAILHARISVMVALLHAQLLVFISVQMHVLELQPLLL